MFVDDLGEAIRNNNTPPTLSTLTSLGIEHYRIENDGDTEIDVEKNAFLVKIKKERDYNYYDIVDLSQIENRAEKLQSFWREHYHKDEEIRLLLSGDAMFDVRDKSQQDYFVRIHVTKGDMLILPGHTILSLIVTVYPLGGVVAVVPDWRAYYIESYVAEVA